ncbi:hypothetical protein AALO_G00134240, partial [Alosa alosa]
TLSRDAARSLGDTQTQHLGLEPPGDLENPRAPRTPGTPDTPGTPSTPGTGTSKTSRFSHSSSPLNPSIKDSEFELALLGRLLSLTEGLICSRFLCKKMSVPGNQ